MKICHLIYDDIANPWLGGGGAVRARQIYSRLATRHDITLITGFFPGAKREEVIDGIRFVRVGSDRSYARSRLAYCRIAVAELKARQWDIWVNEFSAFAPLRVSASIRRRGVLFFQHFMGRHALAKRPLIGAVAWMAEMRVLGVYPHVLTVSPSVQQQVKQRVDGRSILVDCVYNGVDSSYFDLEPEEHSYMLFFGRADIHMKGLDVLVEAFSLVAEANPGLRLKIAGRSEAKQAQQLRDLVEATGYADRIDLLGGVSEEEKGDLLRCSLFACMPSRYEGWGIAAVEAQATGKAVLATRISGLQDAVRDGETGVLVKAGDAGALATGMRTMLDDEETRQRLGRNAQNWARNFDWDRLASDQEEVYFRALAAMNY
jgi:glycogen synthase